VAFFSHGTTSNNLGEAEPLPWRTFNSNKGSLLSAVKTEQLEFKDPLPLWLPENTLGFIYRFFGLLCGAVARLPDCNLSKVASLTKG
jgi:hypothetical protein